MGKKLYKYLSADLIDYVFPEKDICSLKCSYPKDFNDPYELFLTIDAGDDKQILAQYKEAIGTIPQNPTTCFSTSPAVIPMWAHYGKNQTGIVIEFDENELLSSIKSSWLDDVHYQDSPDNELLELLRLATAWGKFRHIYRVQQLAYRTAYFKKNSCWSYEKERRLVVEESAIVVKNGSMQLMLPAKCVTAIIVGARADRDTRTKVLGLTGNLDCAFYEMRIGKSTSTPFFLSAGEESCVFLDEAIRLCPGFCKKCKEPNNNAKEHCSWCSITDYDEYRAATKNPLRVLAATGLLEDYYKGKF
jgi:hypothetical protein